MPLRPGSFCALLLLLGCATHAEAPQASTATPQASMHATILAMRPVPADAPAPALLQLAGIQLAGLGTPAAASRQAYEFIVRTDSGTTLSIVQPQLRNLHPGDEVSILRGAETRIDAPLGD